jgi:hypothetical protein
MTDIPDGWTDDMNIPLPDGVSVARLCEFVLSSTAAGESHEVRIAALLSWGLTRDDAELACDRALGGAFRAGTTNPQNEPSAEKDPIAHFSYQHCQSKRALLASLFPKDLPSKSSTSSRPWWKFWG